MGLIGATMVAAVNEFTAIGFYLVYAVIAVTVVVFLARLLHKNGQIFLDEAFDQPDLAQAVNQLLVVGFYLLNLGYALMVYRLQPSYDSLTVAFNELVVKIGLLLLSLGVIHLLNMMVFWRIRGSKDQAKRRRYSQPVPQPTAFVPPPPPAPAVAGAPHYPGFGQESIAQAGSGSGAPQ